MLHNEQTPKAEGTVTVGELAGKDIRKMEVFRRFGIDFCCGGGQTLTEACRLAGITEGELQSALRLAELETAEPDQDYGSWDLAKLADHIVDFHHRYVRESLPVLLEYSHRVAAHHGERHPELLELETRVRTEAMDLAGHMDIEEKVLFPAIRQLTKGESSACAVGGQALASEEGSACSIGGQAAPGLPGQRAAFIRTAIRRMLQDHVSSGESLDGFRKMTHNYTAPEGACNSYRFLYDKLREFDTDLQKHIHLENNILFPKTLAISGNQAF
jgi:regulator of cell morphogenesis and NO signaling